MFGSLPYLYAGYATQPGEAFMGFIGRGTPGANSYFAFSRQVAEGNNWLTNLYTPHAPSRAYFNLEWWVIGLAARATGLSLQALFHIERVTAVLLFLVAAYYLCAVFLVSPRERRIALGLIALGSGFGWVIEVADHFFHMTLPTSLDTQGVTLFSYLMNKPHFIRAGACAALQYAWLIRGARTGQQRYFHAAGIAGASHSLIRPYQIPEACLVLGLYAAVQVLQLRTPWRKALWQAAIVFLWNLPVIAWHTSIYLQNPLGLGPMHAWQPMYFFAQIVWLGLPFAALMVYVGLRAVRVHRAPGLSIPVLWLLSAMVLLQLYPVFPWGVESYFPWVLAPPLLFVKHVLPPIALWCRARPAARALRGLAVGLACCAVLPGNAINYARFFTTLHDPVAPWRYYLPLTVRGSVDWLAKHAPPESVVLASHDTSQFVPRLADFRVVSGQDVLSANYRERNAEVLRFYAAREDNDFKLRICRENAVAFIFIGPFERALSGMNSADHPWMVPVYESEDVSIYRVDLPE